MKRSLSLFTLFFIIGFQAKGQLAGTPPTGPVSMSLGGVSSPLSNSWSIFNNPGGLALYNQFDTVFGYQTIFDFAPFNTVSAGLNYHTSFGTTSLGLYRFGTTYLTAPWRSRFW